jgi:hypothetical protein
VAVSSTRDEGAQFRHTHSGRHQIRSPGAQAPLGAEAATLASLPRVNPHMFTSRGDKEADGARAAMISVDSADGAVVLISSTDEMWDLAERAIKHEISQLLLLPQLAWLRPQQSERSALRLPLPASAFASLEAAHDALQALAATSSADVTAALVGPADCHEASRGRQQQQQLQQLQPATRGGPKIRYTGEHLRLQLPATCHRLCCPRPGCAAAQMCCAAQRRGRYQGLAARPQPDLVALSEPELAVAGDEAETDTIVASVAWRAQQDQAPLAGAEATAELDYW